jgi:outer membrane receptor protein involved in Fe transport
LLAASAYLRKIDDVTVTRLFLDGGEWVSTPSNQGSASARGITLEAKLPLPGFPKAAFNGNVARNWSRIDRVPGPDNRLAEQSPLTASVGIDVRAGFHPQLAFGASLTYERGARTRRALDWSEANGGTRLLDMYVLWGAGKQTRLRVGLTDVLHRPRLSESFYGSRSTRREALPGTTLRITFEHDFERLK